MPERKNDRIITYSEWNLSGRVDAAWLRVAIVQKMHTDNVQRNLRGVKANHFPVAGQVNQPLFHAHWRS
jgi:hypothetical protein